MKRILITGGVDGLGFSLAKAYVDQGHKIVVLDIDSKESTEDIQYIQFDLSNFDSEKLENIREGFDIVICNAGISVSGDFKEISFEREMEVFDVNVFGHMKLVKYLFKHDLIKENGRIAFICSASEYLSFPIALAYSASKSALNGFANALDSYALTKNISITRVYPGPMNTAHSKYYPGAATEGGRKPEQSTPAIVRGIERRKRKVFPDPISKVYRVASKLVPRTLARKTFNFYKDRIK